MVLCLKNVKKLLIVPLVASVALSAGVLVFEPARAQAVAILAAVTCTSSQPCATWQNKGTGAAIQATAVGDSIEGISSGSGKSGVFGETVSKSGYGVHGTNSAKGGIAVYGTGGAGTGVEGATTGDPLSNGVFGSATSGRAVYGQASSGTGVYASTSSGPGVQTYSVTGQALYAQTSSVRASTLEADNYGQTVASDIYGGDGEYIFSANGNGALLTNGGSSDSGVVAATQGDNYKYGAIIGGKVNGLLAVDGDGLDGHPLQVSSWTSTGDITGYFNVNGEGDIEYSGRVLTIARTRDGANVTAFETKATQASVEDSGTAHLVAGSAFVPLDPAFARAIDLRSPYRVFLTPEGDTRGLYIAEKTPTGFRVRETQGGRGSFAFDYRILGSAVGAKGERMTLLTPAVAARLFPILAKHRLSNEVSR